MKKIILLSASLLFFSFHCMAAITLPQFFSDGMVLQQQSSAAIWGKSTPSSTITVSCSWDKSSKYKTIAGKDGRWRLSVDTPSAGGPYSITIRENSSSSIVLNDVLIGEVWLCSGQSNMEMPVKGFQGQPVDNSAEVIAVSTNDGLRLFTAARAWSFDKQDDVNGSWMHASPESVRNFSATAYFYGRLLQQTLGIPVGLIATSYAGSNIEAWMNEESLSHFPDIKPIERADNVSAPNRKPMLLYNAMLYPLIGYGIKGCIWYQGESNKEQPEQYYHLFKQMIGQWREEWGSDFPFYYCQIAPYDYSLTGKEHVNSAYLREVQLKLSEDVPSTGIAILMDAGLKTGIHPTNKRAAGERLAYQALAKTYGISGIVADSPSLESFRIQNDTIIVKFKNCDMWLYSPDDELKEFTVAGEDRVFHPAKAWIYRKEVYISSPEVKVPVAARYAFENWSEGRLFSTEGLSVSSWRTDDWPIYRPEK